MLPYIHYAASTYHVANFFWITSLDSHKIKSLRGIWRILCHCLARPHKLKPRLIKNTVSYRFSIPLRRVPIWYSLNNDLSLTNLYGCNVISAKVLVGWVIVGEIIKCYYVLLWRRKGSYKKMLFLKVITLFKFFKIQVKFENSTPPIQERMSKKCRQACARCAAAYSNTQQSIGISCTCF